jgi:hypothetical protein
MIDPAEEKRNKVIAKGLPAGLVELLVEWYFFRRSCRMGFKR